MTGSDRAHQLRTAVGRRRMTGAAASIERQRLIYRHGAAFRLAQDGEQLLVDDGHSMLTLRTRLAADITAWQANLWW